MKMDRRGFFAGAAALLAGLWRGGGEVSEGAAPAPSEEGVADKFGREAKICMVTDCVRGCHTYHVLEELDGLVPLADEYCGWLTYCVPGAALTGLSFDYIHVPVECFDCGEMEAWVLEVLKPRLRPGGRMYVT